MLRRVESKFFVSISGNKRLKLGIFKNTKSGKFYVYQLSKSGKRRIGSRLASGKKLLGGARKIASNTAMKHGFVSKEVAELSRLVMGSKKRKKQKGR